MKKLFFIIIALSFMPVFASVLRADEERIVGVSALALVASPERFNGKMISLTGWLKKEGKSYVLFPSTELAVMSDVSSSIEIFFEEDQKQNWEPLTKILAKNGDISFVRVSGRVNTNGAYKPGSMGPLGELREVTKLWLLQPPPKKKKSN